MQKVLETKTTFSSLIHCIEIAIFWNIDTEPTSKTDLNTEKWKPIDTGSN